MPKAAAPFLGPFYDSNSVVTLYNSHCENILNAHAIHPNQKTRLSRKHGISASRWLPNNPGQNSLVKWQDRAYVSPFFPIKL